MKRAKPSPKAARAPLPATTTATSPPPRRTDAALRPATPLELLVSRALDQELEWYFTYAEAALCRADIGILPSYAAVKVLATEPNDEACRRYAVGLALAVRLSLVALGGAPASVLRAAYTPRRWPRSVETAWGALAGIVVRLWLARHPWPKRWGRSGLEEATASHLAAALAAKQGVPIVRLRDQADRLLRDAVVAYARARALDLGKGAEVAR